MVSSVATLLDTAAADLVLRICGSYRDGQVVRIRADKCTIGAGRRCTLRLRARGVRNLHCLVLRGPARTIVRRWAPDTLLNGHSFTDAEVFAGDRLSVGGLELEVLSAPARQFAPETRLAPPPSCDSETLVALQQLRERLAVSNRLARGRCRQLITKLKANRQRAAELEDTHEEIRCRGQELDATTRQLETTLSELARCRQEYDNHRRQWFEEKSAVEETARRDREELDRRLADLAAQREALETREHELDQARSLLADINGQAELLKAERERLETEQAVFDADRRHWAGHRCETEADLARRSEELDRRLADLATQREALATQEHELNQARSLLADINEAERLKTERERLEAEQSAWEENRRRWDERRTEMEEQFALRNMELDRREASLHQEMEDLRRQRAAWEQETRCDEAGGNAEEAPRVEESSPADGEERNEDWREPEEVQFQAVSEESPLSSLEIFRRLGTVPDLEERNSEPSPAKPASRNPNPAQRRPEPAEDEDSVDSYMARLLERMRVSGGNTNMPASSQDSEPTVSTPFVPAEPVPALSTSIASAPKRTEPVELSPRAAVREKHVDLSAMRELANFSAQTAINRHTQRQIESATRTRLVLAVVSLAVGLGMLWTWWNYEGGRLALGGALASLLVALVWGAQCIILAIQRRHSRTRSPQWNLEQDAACGEPETAEGPSPTGSAVDSRGNRPGTDVSSSQA